MCLVDFFLLLLLLLFPSSSSSFSVSLRSFWRRWETNACLRQDSVSYVTVTGLVLSRFFFLHRLRRRCLFFAVFSSFFVFCWWWWWWEGLPFLHVSSKQWHHSINHHEQIFRSAWKIRFCSAERRKDAAKPEEKDSPECLRCLCNSVFTSKWDNHDCRLRPSRMQMLKMQDEGEKIERDGGRRREEGGRRDLLLLRRLSHNVVSERDEEEGEGAEEKAEKQRKEVLYLAGMMMMRARR